LFSCFRDWFFQSITKTRNDENAKKAVVIEFLCKALIAEEGLDVKLLEQSLGDLATLAEQAATKEAIANAFGVPLSYLTATTNRANLEAADSQQVENFEFRP